MRIGEILIKSAVIDTKALDDALAYASYKTIPLGRALRVLRYITEEDLTRGLEAQSAIRKGLDGDVAVSVLKGACQTNRTFMQALAGGIGLGREALPPGMIESILAKKSSSPKPDASGSMVKPVIRRIPTTANSHEELIEIGDSAFLTNELESAETAYLHAKELIEDAFGVPPSKVARVLTKLANLYFTTDRFQLAQPLYERVLELHKKVFGVNSPEATRAYEDLGDLYDIQDKSPEAQKFYDEALKSMHNQKLLDEETAGRLLKKLLSLSQRSGQPLARARLGELAVDSGLITQENLQTALQSARDSGLPLGTVLRTNNLVDAQQVESLMFAQVLVKQGTLPADIAVRALQFAAARKVPVKHLCEVGKWIAARELDDEQYRQLVLEQERLLTAEASKGSDSAEVAAIAQKVAEIHLARQDRVAAEGLYKRAITILQKDATANKRELLKATERLSEIYCQNARYPEAQPLLLKALEYRNTLGLGETTDTAKCLWQVAKVELAQCNHYTAISFMRSARAIYEKLGAGESPKQLLEQMVSSCRETGNNQDLEPVLNQLIQMAKRSDKGFEPETADYLEQLGDLYCDLGRASDASAQYNASLQIYERAPGAQSRAAAVSKKLAKAMDASKQGV
jgi:Tetratricopeptide repeat